MERKNFGLKELDSMIEGGIPSDSIVGISGPPGVGKTIFTMHFLLEGARKGEKCVYINFEEPEKNIEKMLSRFKFKKEFEKYREEGKIVVKCLDFVNFEKTYPELLKRINENNDIKRLVIDSFNCFFNYFVGTNSTNEVTNRRLLNKSISIFRKNEATTLITMEKAKDDTNVGNLNVSYVIDGHIMLDFMEFGTIERRVFIPKMRWTNQAKEGKNYEISKTGINITDEEV